MSIFKRQWATGTYEPACEVGFERFNTVERTERLVARGMRAGARDFTTFSMVREAAEHKDLACCCDYSSLSLSFLHVLPIVFFVTAG